MTDIVERLRGLGCKRAGCDLLRYEAADEIERLRTDVALGAKAASDFYAENAKLREALEKIADKPLLGPEGSAWGYGECKEIARAALQKDGWE